MKEFYEVYNLGEGFIENIDKFYRDNDDIISNYDPSYEHAYSSEYAEYCKLSNEDFMNENNMYSDNWLDDIDYSDIELDSNRKENTIRDLRIDINKVVKTFRYFNWREPYSDDEILNYVENGQFDEDYNNYVHIMKCNKSDKKSKEENIVPQTMLRSAFDERVYDTWGDTISRVGEYKSATEHMVFKCNKCGSMFAEIGRYVYDGKGCPSCNKHISKGENVVEEILKELNIGFEKQYSDGCRNPKTNRELPFDFVISNYGNTIYIEVQGSQHYIPVEHFGGYDNYKSVKYRDDIKKKYAEDNGIFVELDYREHDINLLKERVCEKLLPLLKEVI